MLRLINETPFETNITLHGRIRLKVHPPHITKQLDQSPPLREYCTEWIHILKNGPLYQQVDYCIDPWTSYEILMSGKGVTSLTMGFNDVRTAWTRHTPGVYEWDSNFNEVTITCQPGKHKVTRQRRGPAIFGDIPLHIITKSENPSWKVVDEPITTVQYSPNFNENYYKEERR